VDEAMIQDFEERFYYYTAKPLNYLFALLVFHQESGLLRPSNLMLAKRFHNLGGKK
jgi:hypothetical protein